MTKPSSTARASLAGAIVAAFAASACCLGPAILAIAGLSGVGFAAALEPYRPLLLALTAALLGVGFWLTYRRPRTATAVGAAQAATGGEACGVDGCEMPRANRAGKIALWVATFVVLLFAGYPYLAGALATTEARGSTSAAAAVETKTATLSVGGMDCEGCTTQIVKDLAALDGVIEAKVSFADRTATVVYDPSRVQPARFVATIEALGYTAAQGG